MIYFWLALTAYISVSLFMVYRSRSHGFIADLIFAVFWPYFLWRHHKKGW